MTRDEIKTLLKGMSMAYPNYKPIDLTGTADLWAALMADYSYREASDALQSYICSDVSGFAPSIGQLIAMIQTVRGKDEMTPLEAWAVVYKAICRSGYDAEAEFSKLPPLCQQAVGNPSNLEEWSQMDIPVVQSVAQSHFVRVYDTLLKSKQQADRMPKPIRDRIAQSFSERSSGQSAGKITQKDSPAMRPDAEDTEKPETAQGLNAERVEKLERLKELLRRGWTEAVG